MSGESEDGMKMGKQEVCVAGGRGEFWGDWRNSERDRDKETAPSRALETTACLGDGWYEKDGWPAKRSAHSLLNNPSQKEDPHQQRKRRRAKREQIGRSKEVRGECERNRWEADDTIRWGQRLREEQWRGGGQSDSKRRLWFKNRSSLNYSFRNQYNSLQQRLKKDLKRGRWED